MSSFAFALDDKNNRRITDENLTWCITPLNIPNETLKGVASIKCLLLWGSSPVPNWVNHCRMLLISYRVNRQKNLNALEKTHRSLCRNQTPLHPKVQRLVSSSVGAGSGLALTTGTPQTSMLLCHSFHPPHPHKVIEWARLCASL